MIIGNTYWIDDGWYVLVAIEEHTMEDGTTYNVYIFEKSIEAS